VNSSSQDIPFFEAGGSAPRDFLAQAKAPDLFLELNIPPTFFFKKDAGISYPVQICVP